MAVKICFYYRRSRSHETLSRMQFYLVWDGFLPKDILTSEWSAPKLALHVSETVYKIQPVIQWIIATFFRECDQSEPLTQTFTNILRHYNGFCVVFYHHELVCMRQHSDKTTCFLHLFLHSFFGSKVRKPRADAPKLFPRTFLTVLFEQFKRPPRLNPLVPDIQNQKWTFDDKSVTHRYRFWPEGTLKILQKYLAVKYGVLFCLDAISHHKI